jgi:hypothetical protein
MWGIEAEQKKQEEGDTASTLYATSVLVGGGNQYQAPDVLPPQTAVHIVLSTRAWVDPTAGLDVHVKSLLTGIRSPAHPARSQFL